MILIDLKKNIIYSLPKKSDQEFILLYQFINAIF